MVDFDTMCAQIQQEHYETDIPGIKPRAGIYVRKSNKDEGGRNKSCDEQLQMCLRVAIRFKFEVAEAHIYREEEGQKGDWWWNDGSGYHPKPYRPELTRLMQDVEAGLIDVVVVWRSDRLYRDSGVCDGLMKVFRSKGVRFVAGLRDMDVTSASGLFSASTEAANNRRWRDTISEDIKRDHNFKAEMGMFSRDPTCMGYKSCGRGTQEVECIEEQLALVRRIFRLFVLGEGDRGPKGVTGIARQLMDERTVWPKGRKGHTFVHASKIYTSDIRVVLENCMYIGRWKHDGKEYVCDKLLVPVLDAEGKPTGKPETAVPIALFEAAKEKLARLDRPGKRSSGSEHLLTGLTVCARCGRPLQVHFTAYKIAKGQHSGEARTPRRNFTCLHKYGTRPCPPGSSFRLQEPVLEEWVLTELAPLLMLEINAMQTSAGHEADVRAHADLERLLKEARTRETKKLVMLLDTLDARQYAAVSAQLRAEREGLERRLAEVRRRLEGAQLHQPDLSPACLESLPKSALKEALSRAIQWIAVGKQGIVVLTSWGSYIAAEFRKHDKTHDREIPKTTYLCAPEPTFTLTCGNVLPDPPEFVRGRRDSMGRKAERLSDDELLPGMTSSAEAEEPYILEVSLPAGTLNENESSAGDGNQSDVGDDQEGSEL